jgi:hypothetical protein
MRVVKQRAFAKANVALMLKWNRESSFSCRARRGLNARLLPPQPSHLPCAARANERKRNNIELCHARAGLGERVRVKTYATLSQVADLVSAAARNNGSRPALWIWIARACPLLSGRTMRARSIWMSLNNAPAEGC